MRSANRPGSIVPMRSAASSQRAGAAVAATDDVGCRQPACLHVLELAHDGARALEVPERRHVAAEQHLDARIERVPVRLQVARPGPQGTLLHPGRHAQVVEERARAGDDQVGTSATPRSAISRGDLGGQFVAVLHAVQAQLDGFGDDRRRSGVRGDLATPRVGGRDRRGHLVSRELRSRDLLVLAGDAARDHELDEVGAGFDLPAHSAGERVRAVAFEGVIGVVAVTAAAAQRLAGGEDPRAGHVARLDRPSQREVGAALLRDAAHGGHSRKEGAARAVGHVQREFVRHRAR